MLIMIWETLAWYLEYLEEAEEQEEEEEEGEAAIHSRQVEAEEDTAHNIPPK